MEPMKVSLQEHHDLTILRHIALGGRVRNVTVPRELFMKMVNALMYQEGPADFTIGRIYGICRKCKAKVPDNCNQCATCADESGP